MPGATSIMVIVHALRPRDGRVTSRAPVQHPASPATPTPSSQTIRTRFRAHSEVVVDPDLISSRQVTRVFEHFRPINPFEHCQANVDSTPVALSQFAWYGARRERVRKKSATQPSARRTGEKQWKPRDVFPHVRLGNPPLYVTNTGRRLLPR